MSSTPPVVLSRRKVFAGAGTAGALAAAATLLPGANAPVTAPVAAAVPPPVDPNGGYQLTAHVQRYYETARA